MRIVPEQLARQLERGLAPLYLVTGDEPLLLEECCDAIRRRAQALGYERQVFTVEPGFDWPALTVAVHSPSLFAAHRLIELRLPGAKPGEAGARTLIELAGERQPEQTLLVVTGRLDKAVRDSAWVRALETAAVTVAVGELSAARFPAWIAARLRAHRLTPEPGVVERLAYHMEGNLLACAQEIDQLALRLAGGALRLGDLEESLSDNARFDVFALADSCLRGEAAAARRQLYSLRAEDCQPTLVLWALARELRTLNAVTHALARGRPESEALAGVWASRRAQTTAAARRLGRSAGPTLLRRAAACDRVIKGRAAGDAWHELERLVLAFCGAEPVARAAAGGLR
jgi:DNA polymerase-3 subunit delta